MQKIIIILLVVCFMAGTCNMPKNEKEMEAPPLHDQDTISLAPGCYRVIIEKDTAMLKIEKNGLHVSGTLMYNMFEKDPTKGKLIGVIEGDKIKAWYHNSSEATFSVREMYFKILKDSLAEGYGEMAQRNDTAYFRFPEALMYEYNHPFLPVDCSLITN